MTAQAVSETPTLEDELRDWLGRELPDGWMEAVDAGDDGKFAEVRKELDYDSWCERLADAGWATPTWPAEYGAGRSLSPSEARPINEILAHYKVPRSYNIIGIGMGGPTVIEHGSEEMKKRLLAPIARGTEIWCQLFSEPSAGSDVAGLATRAVRDGDEWIVNGQKVWTTLAHIARWGMIIVRTNPDVPKHQGLSYFVVDMHAPGVTVKPLVQMTGDAEFNEVFFDEVRIPDSMRLGPEGEGWRVAITTLMNERVALSGAGSVGGDAVGGSPVSRLLDRHRPITDPVLRQRAAQAWMENRVIGLTNGRASAARKSGEAGPEGSVTKLFQAEFNQRLQELAIDLEGSDALAWAASGDRTALPGWVHTAEIDHGTVVAGFLRSRANTIEGGTSEIMRNILGERVLGLPKEPQVDREIPWKDVLRSG
ncbi:MAG: acyl-CoA dehydrogenase family protein [Acidimicrobiia bacterium]|nr:acyl-CoA dehydrogenase family protein [Acidimicrobiia bacterium]